jgi:transporter family-2 protein
LVSACAIDHFGLFGAPRVPMTWLRGAGLALMAAGVVLARQPFR